MPKTPRVAGDKAVAAFLRAGFVVTRINGSHHILKRAADAARLSIPVHAGKIVGTGLLDSQIKRAGLTTQQFIELLKG